MNLLLISVKSDTAYGGIAVWTERFLSRCDELNISCSLVNTDLIGSRIQSGKRKLWDEFVRTCRIFRDLKRSLKAESFDAAYLNTSCGSFGLFRDKRIARLIFKKNIPLVTQYHCEIPWWVRKKISQRCLGQLAAMSRKNLVLCQNSKNFLKEHYNIDSVKIPNFVELDQVLSQPKIIREKIQRICFVGRISEVKGARELYEVAGKIPEITFELIGEVETGVTGWDKPKNVSLPGSMENDEVLKRLDEADIFLFPSHTEGCSMALMEAMARGLPCIATDVGANADMLGGGCGVIVAKHDTEAMVKAIRVLEEPLLRRTMSHNATQKIRQSYTNKNVDKILAVVQGLQQERGAFL